MRNFLSRRRVLHWLLIFAIAGLVHPAAAAVRVRGYHRKDGTYVRPHYRSEPNGRFYDNWSTYPNRNPFTGQIGTKRTPPAGYGSNQRKVGSSAVALSFSSGSYGEPSPASRPPKKPTRSYDHEARKKRDAEIRQRFAADMAAGGFDGSWQDYTSLELGTMRLRMQLADEITRGGFPVDWKERSERELYDIKMRMALAESIRKLGFEINWQAYTLHEMVDIDSRVQLVRYLRNRGLMVSWKDYTAEQLAKMRLAHDASY